MSCVRPGDEARPTDLRKPVILLRVAVPLSVIQAPMAATEVPRPFDRSGWVYEEKVDGWCVQEHPLA